jgi:putative transport protein
MPQFIIDNPILVIAFIAAIGYAVGHIKIAGTSLGIAAVLFVGLAVGALDPRLKLPDIVYQLGLVIFVYTIGLSCGPNFFHGLRHQGVRNVLLVIGALVLGAVGVAVFQRTLGLQPALAAGLFTGSFTNTPALAAVLDYIRQQADPALREQLLNEPVVSYSAAYALGVVGPILMMILFRKLWRIDYAQEAEQLRAQGVLEDHLQQRTVRVTFPSVVNTPIAQLTRANHWQVVFGRVKRNEHLALATGDTRFELGDLVSMVGTSEHLDQATRALGTPCSEQLNLDRSELDYRRIFVSNQSVAGQRLSDLHLPQRFGAVVTRVRRGDNDLLPHGDTVLELGDRVRVVTNPGRMEAVSAFFGDSYRALSEVNILTLSLGLLLGLLIGLIQVPLPGGIHLSLGYAGGPLVVALILGTVARTGKLIWTLPYSANLTLRQIGLILFLAGVGTRAGSSLLVTFTQGNGIQLVLAGAVVTCGITLLTMWVGYSLLRIPMSILVGMIAGLQTHPALLSFATEQTGNDVPEIGYAAVYPIAIIAKIIIAQLLLAWLW